MTVDNERLIVTLEGETRGGGGGENGGGGRERGGAAVTQTDVRT